MLDEIPLPLRLIDLVILSACVVATSLVLRRLLLGVPLLPFTERPDYDMGGIIGWPVRWWNRKWDEDAPPPKELSWRTVAADVRLGLIAFLISFMPVMLLQAFLVQYFKYEHPSITEAKEHFWSVAFQVIIFVPLFEELVFRNFLQGTLEVLERAFISNESGESRWQFGVAPIILSSLLFAGAHWGQGPAPAPLFLFALVLGYLYFQTHRIMPSIVAHAALNGFTMVQLWFLPQS